MDTILFLLAALVVIASSGAIGHKIGKRNSFSKQYQTIIMQNADLLAALSGYSTQIEGIVPQIAAVVASTGTVPPEIEAAVTKLGTDIASISAALVPVPATPAA